MIQRHRNKTQGLFCAYADFGCSLYISFIAINKSLLLISNSFVSLETLQARNAAEKVLQSDGR